MPLSRCASWKVARSKRCLVLLTSKRQCSSAQRPLLIVVFGFSPRNISRLPGVAQGSCISSNRWWRRPHPSDADGLGSGFSLVGSESEHTGAAARDVATEAVRAPPQAPM